MLLYRRIIELKLFYKEIKTLEAGKIAARAGIDKTTARNIENFTKDKVALMITVAAIKAYL